MDRESACLKSVMNINSGFMYHMKRSERFPMLICNYLSCFRTRPGIFPLLKLIRGKLNTGGILYMTVPNINFVNLEYNTSIQITGSCFLLWRGDYLMALYNRPASISLISGKYRLERLLGAVVLNSVSQDAPAKVKYIDTGKNRLAQGGASCGYFRQLNRLIIPLKRDNFMAGEIMIIARKSVKVNNLSAIGNKI